MEYGLKVYNDDLVLIIDSLYPNVALWEHGESVNTINQGSWHGKQIVFSTPSAKPPLIAIKPASDDYCGFSYYTKAGGNYTGFWVLSEDKVVTFDWQAFVPRTDKSDEIYGLRIYDATPTLVFDSGYAPMIIIDVNNASPAYSAVTTITHPSEANAYHIVSPHGFIQKWTGGSPPPGPGSNMIFYMPMLKSLSATTVSFGGLQYVDVHIPGYVNGNYGNWPGTWTIMTVKKAF